MPAYENHSARLKHQSALVSAMSAKSHHLYPPSASSSSLARSKQRKWRVLLSIGLLLPALAAIIGIVAWAISIEVTNGGSSSSPVNSAALHRKQQQLNHLKPQASAQPLYRHFRRHQPDGAAAPQQQQQLQPQPMAAQLLAPASPSSPATASSSRKSSTEVKSEQPKQSVVSRKKERRQQKQRRQEQEAEAERKAEQTIDQEEATEAKSIEEESSPAKKGDPVSEPMFAEEKDMRAGDFGAAATTTTEKPSIGNDDSAGSGRRKDPEDAGDEQPESGSSALPLTSRDQGEALSGSTEAAASESPTTTTTLQPTTTSAGEDEQQEQLESESDGSEKRSQASGSVATMMLLKNSSHKSRWFNERTSQGMKKPINVGSASKLSGLKQQQQQEAQTGTDDAGQRASSPATKRRGAEDSSRREAAKPEAAGKRNRKQQAAELESKSPAAKGIEYMIVQDDGSSAVESDNNEQQPAAGKLAASTTEKPEDCAGDNSQRNVKNNSNKLKQLDAQASSAAIGSTDDEQLSFEAIASAISTSLNEEQKAATAAPSHSLDQMADEVDDFSAMMNENSGKPSGQEASATMKRRQRTAGEHVAEVIDHLVERRKASELVNEAPSRRGPQIVVVAPVGSSDMMKARSLTREADKATERKDAVALKSTSKTSKRPAKPLGARLLGTLGDPLPASDSGIKYSERVEVIEDDDSSALLMKSSQVDELSNRSDRDLSDEQQPAAEVLISKPKITEHSEQPQLDSDQADSIHVSSHSGEPRSRSPRHELAPRMAFERFAAAEVSPPRQSEPNSSQPKLYSAEQLIREHVMKSKLKNQQQPQQQQQPQLQEKRPAQPQHEAEQMPDHSPVSVSVSVPAPAPVSVPNPVPSQAQARHQIKLVPTTIRPSTSSTEQTSSTAAPAAQQPKDFRQAPAEPMRPYSSSMQPVRVPLFVHQHQQLAQHQHQIAPMESYQVLESQPQAQQSLAPHHQQLAPSQAQQVSHQFNQEAQAAASQLPTFADQEYNVPAHLAESVIQDIQRSPSTLNMVNGQATLVSSNGQVPFYGQQAPDMYASASQLQPQQVAWSQQVAQQMLLARHFAQQQQQQQQQQHQRLLQHQQNQQVLANREGMEASAASAKRTTTPRGLLAQAALRHLIQSFGQQAAAQEAAANEQTIQSRSMAPLNSQKTGPADAPGQALIQADPMAAAGSSQRHMRSLSGQQAPTQQLSVAPDQELAESSYQQMPAHYGGGGYSQPAYGGHEQYQDNNDKKSKGMTFHFGGGPIGGGTQLITSPMGIFKHLMIPLLPNPRVNLNGKVVFGVVLEKTTAFGEPKKKYKFWGR